VAYLEFEKGRKGATYLLLVDDGLRKRQLFSCPYLPGSRPICF